MKIIALFLALALSACSGTLGGILNPQVGISNPVTKDMLYEVENGAIVAFAGLKAYKRACINLDIPQSCRDTIRGIQVYTRQIPPYLSQLRRFVRNNDQINAVTVFNILQGLLVQARAPGV